MTMVRTHPSNGNLVRRRDSAFYIAVLAVFLLTVLYIASNRGGDTSTVANSGSGEPEVSPQLAAQKTVAGVQTALNQGLSAITSASKNKEQLDEEDVDPMSITQNSVTYGDSKTLAYYHCGPTHVDNPDLTELILLHGAAFTKEDWKKSGILDMLCEINNEEDEGNLSIAALDLPVSADGIELGKAFDALKSNNALSGEPSLACVFA